MANRNIVALGVLLALVGLAALALSLAKRSSEAGARPSTSPGVVPGPEVARLEAPAAGELAPAGAPGPVRLAAPAEGRGAARAADKAGPPETLQPAAAGCTLRGTLFGADGSPMPTDGAIVQAIDSSGLIRSSRVDRGEYAVRGLGPGRWWVTARAGEREIEQEVTIAAGQAEYWLDLTLPPARVIDVFVITGDGQGFARAARELHIRTASTLVAVATRDVPGAILRGGALARVAAPLRPVRPGAPWARLVLEDEGAVHVSLVLHEAVLTTERVPPAGTSVTLAFEPRALKHLTASLRLRLADARSGAPIEKGVCLLTSGNSMNLVETGEDGRAELTDCAPGYAQLKLQCEGYAVHERELRLAPGETLDLGTIAIGRSLQVMGRVVTSRAPGRATIHVARRDPETGVTQFDERLGHSPARDGEFCIELAEGLWVLRAVDHHEDRPRLSANHLVDLRAGSVDGLSIELHPAVRVVLRPEGGGWVGAGYTIVDDSGLTRAAGSLPGSRPLPVDLPPGEYVLEVVQDGGRRVDARFLASGEVTEVALR